MGYFNSKVASPASFQENAYMGQYDDSVSQENLQFNTELQEGAMDGSEDSGIIDMEALVEQEGKKAVVYLFRTLARLKGNVVREMFHLV